MAAKLDDDHPYGKDGWPVDERSDGELARARSARFGREMRAAHTRWQGDDLTAFTEAVRLYWCQGLLPDWMLDATRSLVERAMSEDERRARREFRIHLRRWELVVELRERGDELNTPLRDVRGRVTWEGNDCGTTDGKAYLAVSEVLTNEKDEAAGGDRAVEESYRLIEAAGGKHATFETYLKERERRERRRHGKDQTPPD